jgi:hypothetical protein
MHHWFDLRRNHSLICLLPVTMATEVIGSRLQDHLFRQLNFPWDHGEICPHAESGDHLNGIYRVRHRDKLWSDFYLPGPFNGSTGSECTVLICVLFLRPGATATKPRPTNRGFFWERGSSMECGGRDSKGLAALKPIYLNVFSWHLSVNLRCVAWTAKWSEKLFSYFWFTILIFLSSCRY